MSEKIPSQRHSQVLSPLVHQTLRARVTCERDRRRAAFAAAENEDKGLVAMPRSVDLQSLPLSLQPLPSGAEIVFLKVA